MGSLEGNIITMAFFGSYSAIEKELPRRGGRINKILRSRFTLARRTPG